MKPPALQRFRARLAADESVLGLWVTLESPSLTELAVALDLDWVVIDAEHGHLDWKEINEHVRAAVRSHTVVLVRLAERSTSLAKRALDIGADGVVIPGVETVDQLEQAVCDCRYPPEGRRGIGGERATAWGQCLREHADVANDQVLVVPLIESVGAIPNMEALCGVTGVDVFYFGPADFSASAGFRGQWQGPGVAEQILQLKDTIRRSGKRCGVLSGGVQDLLDRREKGFQMLGLGSDMGLLSRSLHESLRAVGRDRALSMTLDPAESLPVADPLPRPPASIQPDRDEVITSVGQGETLQVQQGVRFESLMGAWNTARNLTTGIVTFDAEAKLDCHTHPCSESITVLEGTLDVTVEGRRYRLGPLDNIVIPRWVPHAARNPQPRADTRIHIALALAVPQRDLVTREMPTVDMPNDSNGRPGMERVTRAQAARRSFHIGPGTEFVDFFNGELIPGIEMSGGYGRFQPGGRLPAHLHDFDESICIIDGTATCVVEGREYSLTRCDTAMVPRGRVHYFKNESSTTMDMIWVYAGSLPQRIVVDESWVREVTS
jgi:2-keto-3-deoxy-L-rhamnonate aldolase RhmA/quercetin dioxygenase-like cupin family protein